MAFGDIVRSVASPSSIPYGIGGDANTIWHCNVNPDTVYELSTTDFSVDRQRASPAGTPNGIGGDANTIWHSDSTADQVYELFTTDLSRDRQANSPSSNPRGIGGDANTIWHSDIGTNLIYELSTTDFSVDRSAVDPAGGSSGTGGDANTIWHCDGLAPDQIFELSTTDFSVDRQANSPSTSSTGIGGDANTIWHNDSDADQIYELDADVAVVPDPPTNVAATENQSDKVVVTWTKSDGANQYQVKRDGVGLGWLGDVATYDDAGADAPLITAGASVATDGDHTDKVALSLAGTSVANGTTHTYVVEARLDGGDSSGDSGSDTGYRLASALTYQWQKSAADSDASYSNIIGATSSTYNDTAAPAPTITPGTGAATDGLTAYVTLSLSGESTTVGAGRYYQCVLVSTDASNTPATATANRGYRGVGSLTYQWQVSAADSDASYSNISGGTTEPYNYEVTHTDGRYYKCVENATGATEQTSSADRGWRKPLAVTDGDLIGISIIRKS